MGQLKIGQVLIAAGLSALIFAGVYLTEKSRFDNKVTVTNPFSEAVKLQNDIDINIGEEYKDIFTNHGEFWRVFPETEVEFRGGQRNLKKGKVFYSGNYVSLEDSKKAQESYIENFNPEEFKPLVGQLRVGKAVINSPSASVLINRDILRDEIIVYAHDHSVEIFLPGSKTAFVLPPRNQVTMKESRLDKTGQLFYTKLKKEFRMKTISEVIITEESELRPPAEVVAAIEARNERYQRIKTYASESVFSWSRFKPSSFMGIFTNTVKYIQRHYAVGYKKTQKIEYQYETMKKDLLNAFFAFEEGNPAEAKDAAIRFSNKVTSNEWVRFMIENPSYAKDWEIFSRSQKIWLQNIFPDESEKLFRTIWFLEGRITSFSEFKTKFYTTEKTIAQGFTTQAREQMITLADAFPTIIDIKPENAVELTKIRRLLGEILKQDTFLRSPEIFDLYTKIIQSENTLYIEDSEEKQEISLESAKDILFFIKEFINSETGTEISQILVKSYKILKIDEIASNKGRDKIFTAEQLQTIQDVQFINNSKLTAEDLENIQQQQSLLQIARLELQQLEQEQQQQQNQENVVDNSIKDGAELKTLLADNGVNIQAIVIKERAKEDNLFIIFQDATFNGIQVSGTFETATQVFRLLKMGEVTQNNDLFEITPDILPRMLANMRDENLEKQSNNTTQPVDDGPSNDTSLAVIQRTVVSRKLGNQGISASRDQIRILNDDFSLYEIKRATLDNRYRISFIYDQNSGEVTNISVQAGRNEFELVDMIFDINSLGNDLRKEITDQLDEEL